MAAAASGECRRFTLPTGDERRPRDLLLHPINLAPLPVIPLYVLGQRYGFVSDAPLWLLLGALLTAHLGTLTFALVFRPDESYRRAIAHLACESFLIALNMYVIGWGAILAIGFVFGAAGHMAVNGSRIGRAAIITTIANVALGELAVAFGLVDSLMPQPEGHGLAVMSTVGVCLVIWLIQWTYAEKEHAELTIRRSEERLRALVQHASDVIMVIGVDGKVDYASPALQRLLGYEEGGLERIGSDVIHPDDVERAADFFKALVETSGEVAWIELPLRHYDGTYRWFEVGVTNRLDDPSVRGMVCNMRDVTERLLAAEQLAYQAHHDALTKLPNRRYFLERLEHALEMAATSGRYVAVLFLDVDRFKIVNDSLGHEVGDRLLVTVADRLAGCLRPSDVVARFGGDEFTILLTDFAEPQGAITVADRITDRLRQPVAVGDHELFVSASIGISLSQGGQELAGDLLRQADLAMYVAKEKGRSRYELFDAGLAPHVVERLELEADLWRAVENGELHVHYQPEIDVYSGRVVAVEALVRWSHPRRGMLQPGSFIPFAEESSLIVAIDRYVLREASAWARQWAQDRNSAERLVVSVNLSPRFMRQKDMVADVTEIVRDTGVDPRCLQLEITERSALTDLETTCVQLHQLRAFGIRVAIDDFGTGYSSLSYLKRLPVDVLKLDRSFLEGIDTVETDVAIVEAVITMGHALGMKVTAEGVERSGQAARLRDLGCDTAMGWLWSPAVEPEALRDRLDSGFVIDRDEGDDGVVVRLRAPA